MRWMCNASRARCEASRFGLSGWACGPQIVRQALRRISNGLRWAFDCAAALLGGVVAVEHAPAFPATPLYVSAELVSAAERPNGLFAPSKDRRARPLPQAVSP